MPIYSPRRARCGGVAPVVCARCTPASGACVYGGKSGIHTSVSVSYRDLEARLEPLGGAVTTVAKNLSVVTVSGLGCLKMFFRYRLSQVRVFEFV